MAIPVRAAVNTGEAVVTFATGPQIGENVAGDVVNTASRLQGVAPHGGVVVGESTYRSTRDAVDYRELEPVEVKGKAEPLRVWLVGSVRTETPGRADEDATPVRRTRARTTPAPRALRPLRAGVVAAARHDRRRARYREDPSGRRSPRTPVDRDRSRDVVPRSLPSLRRVRHVRAARGDRARSHRRDALGRSRGSCRQARGPHRPFGAARHGSRVAPRPPRAPHRAGGAELDGSRIEPSRSRHGRGSWSPKPHGHRSFSPSRISTGRTRPCSISWISWTTRPTSRRSCWWGPPGPSSSTFAPGGAAARRTLRRSRFRRCRKTRCSSCWPSCSCARSCPPIHRHRSCRAREAIRCTRSSSSGCSATAGSWPTPAPSRCRTRSRR